MPGPAPSGLKKLWWRTEARLQSMVHPRRRGWVEVTRNGRRWRLCVDRYIDSQIYRHGLFEPATTHWVHSFVRPGMNILDVGANIGYFTLMFADAVGRAGHVWAFEPTPDYQERIADHLARNGLGDRVTLLPVGLSDRRQTCPISVGPCSATLHPVSADDTHAVRQVQLQPLDDLAQHLQLPRIDLIKIDIDGHEPAMLRGGEQLIRRDRPAIIIEFAQANLFSAGSDVLRLQAQLHDLGYQLHNEDTRAPYPSQHAFLQACGNYTHSANVWAFPAEAPAALAA